MPAAALADPPACPPTPPAYGGSDPVVAEMRDLRTDVAASCAALLDPAASAAGSLSAANASLSQLVDDSAAVRGDVADLTTDVEAVVAGTGGAAVHATLTNPPDASAAVVATTDVGEVLHTDLWFMVGVVASLLGAFALYRLVMPRA